MKEKGLPESLVHHISEYEANKMRIEIGDIVQIKFIDHFEFQGKKPDRQMILQSFGRLTHDEPEGYAITQTEVYEADPALVEPNQTGQWIFKSAVTEIVKLEPNKKG